MRVALNPKAIFLSLGCLLVALLLAQSSWAQFGRRRAPVQNDPPPAELTVARLHFGTNGAIGHMGWSHNYPESDRNLNEFLERATNIDLRIESYRIVELGSDEVFDYPFAYISEPGEMELTGQEVHNLREYIERGGFILMDDFDGADQWNQMHSQIIKTFPGKDFTPIPGDHSVYTAHTPLENLQAMSDHVPGGAITYYGLYDDTGRLAIMAGHNNDLANFWEWYSNGRMPLKPSTDAFRLGTNAVVYAFSH